MTAQGILIWIPGSLCSPGAGAYRPLLWRTSGIKEMVLKMKLFQAISAVLLLTLLLSSGCSSSTTSDITQAGEDTVQSQVEQESSAASLIIFRRYFGISIASSFFFGTGILIIGAGAILGNSSILNIFLYGSSVYVCLSMKNRGTQYCVPLFWYKLEAVLWAG